MKQYIEDCRNKAEEIVRLEALEVGSREVAMREISRRHRIPYQLLWNLKYRPPKSIAFDLVMAIRDLYRRKCREVAGKLIDEADATLSQDGLNDVDMAVLLAARRAGNSVEEEDRRSGGRGGAIGLPA